MTIKRIAPEQNKPYIEPMGAATGKLYRVKHGRPLWAIGPEKQHPEYRDDFCLSKVQDGDLVVYLGEFRSPAGQLEWVKVIHGESYGYLQCQMLSVGSLLERAEEEPTTAPD